MLFAVVASRLIFTLYEEPLRKAPPPPRFWTVSMPVDRAMTAEPYLRRADF
jgi:hypothetical protein